MPQTKKDIHEGVGGGSIGIRQGSGRGKKSYPRRTTKGMNNALMKGVNHVPGFCLARERGRPARMLSLWLPLSFRAMLQQAATLSAGTASARPGEPWRRSRLIQVGEMAEAVSLVRAGRPRSQEAITHDIAGHQTADAFWALRAVEAGPSVFRSIRVYSCPFVAHLLTSRFSSNDPHGTAGNGLARERGRPARMLSLWLPLSFSAMPQAATLPAGTASARPKESHGAVPG